MVNRISDEKFENADIDTKKRINSIRLKYSNNKWWESDDLRVYVYYQLKENVLMEEFDEFHEAVELLLNRPVYTHEFGLNWNGLLEEAEIAYVMYKSGEMLNTSNNYKMAKVNESIEILKKYCDNHNKKLVVISEDIVDNKC